jgi:hypothetical protein
MPRCLRRVRPLSENGHPPNRTELSRFLYRLPDAEAGDRMRALWAEARAKMTGSTVILPT